MADSWDPAVAPYVDREVSWTVAGQTLHGQTGLGLFSRAHIDAGTKALLDSLDSARHPDLAASPPGTIVDLGCGWGPLTIGLAAAYPNARVIGLDRDYLAVRMTQSNAAANALENVDAIQSLGYSALLGPAGEGEGGGRIMADWIVGNLPAKVGSTGLLDLMFGAGPILARGGRISIVVVAPLREEIEEHIETMRNLADVEVLETVVRSEHIIWHLRLPDGLPALTYGLQAEDAVDPARGSEAGDETGDADGDWEAEYGVPSDGLIPMRREDAPIEIDGIPWEAVFNLPEFDTLDHRHDLLLKVMHHAVPMPAADAEPRERIAVLNPMHGLFLRDLLPERRPHEVVLVDRDLLALTASLRNTEHWLDAKWSAESDPIGRVTCVTGLALDREDAEDGDGDDHPCRDLDIVCGIVRSDEGRGGLRRLLEQAERALKPDGVVVLGMAAAELQTLLKPSLPTGWRVGRSLKRKGFIGVLVRPPKPNPAT